MATSEDRGEYADFHDASSDVYCDSMPPAVSVLSREAATMRREFEKRLSHLVEGAITSRSRATQYFRIARRFLAAARRARRAQDRLRFEAHVREVRHAHQQARKCLGFARLCERRVDCLAAIGGYPDRGRS